MDIISFIHSTTYKRSWIYVVLWRHTGT